MELNAPIARGWMCPACGKAHGPHVNTCPEHAAAPATPMQPLPNWTLPNPPPVIPSVTLPNVFPAPPWVTTCSNEMKAN